MSLAPESYFTGRIHAVQIGFRQICLSLANQHISYWPHCRKYHIYMWEMVRSRLNTRVLMNPICCSPRLHRCTLFLLLLLNGASISQVLRGFWMDQSRMASSIIFGYWSSKITLSNEFIWRVCNAGFWTTWRVVRALSDHRINLRGYYSITEKIQLFLYQEVWLNGYRYLDQQEKRHLMNSVPLLQSE